MRKAGTPFPLKMKHLPLGIRTRKNWLKNEEIRTKIRESIERLDTKHRAVFVLRDMEGLSTREVAQALEISESNVKIRLMRARLAIRDFLGTFIAIL